MSDTMSIKQIIVLLIKILEVIDYGQTFQTGCDSRPQWTASGISSCIFLSTDQAPDVMTWQEAHDQCVFDNPWSTLAVMPTDEHHTIIASKAKNSTAYWVGIRVPSNDSRPYTWMDGTAETRNSLFPGNLAGIVPAGKSLPSHLCGHVTLTIQPAHRQLSWSFGECLNRRPYICIVDKAHVAYTTTPTTTTMKTLQAQAPPGITKTQISRRKTGGNIYTAQIEREVKVTHGCLHETKAVECLENVLSPHRQRFDDSRAIWKSSLLLMGDMLSALVSSTSNRVESVAEDFLHLLCALLQETNKGRLSYTSKNINTMQEAIDTFADAMAIKAENISFNSSIAQFTRTHLEIQLTKRKVASVQGKEMKLKNVEIKIDNVWDISGHKPILDTDEVTILAMVSRVSGSKSWLVDDDRHDRKPQEIKRTSPILTLSASVRGQLVSLEHSFQFSSNLYERHVNEENKEPICSFRLRHRKHSYWDDAGCDTILQVNHGAERCHNNSQKNNNSSRASQQHHAGNSSECGHESNETNTIECRCNHTTSFAIIMSIVDIQLDTANALALDIITYIGCGLTIVSMCIAITVFTCIRSLDSERVCVHRNLCVAILLSQLIFLMGVQAVNHKVICRLVALMLHYFYMATFVWMLVEGLHLYSQVVRVFGTERSRIAYYMCFGWGFPFLEVAVSAAIDWEGYGTARSCWLSIERSTIWAFVGPALSILFVNLLILTVVMRIIVLAAKVEKMDEINHIRAGVKASLFLSPLLGITWLFGLAAVNKDLLIFQYIFSILNSLQGFFIFLYHCVFNTDVRQTLKRIKDKRMLQKEFRSSSGSSQRASCSDNGTDLTPKQSTTPVFKRIRQVSPEIGEKDEIPTCHHSNASNISNKSEGLTLMHI